MLKSSPRLALVLGSLVMSTALAAAPVDVTVENRSVPTLCAETDNVHLTFTDPRVTRFTVEARHPAYMGTIVVDNFAPDWTNCDMSNDPFFTFEPRRITLYEDPQTMLVGYTFERNWRPNRVPVVVNGRETGPIHLVQLWTRVPTGWEEYLVVYPADGYWRAKPQPPRHLKWSAYGSSFLVGPIEDDGRPVVNIDRITFDPASKTFTLAFSRGGTGTVRVTTADNERTMIEVALDRPVVGGAPFAAIRSMYVTDFNADASRVAWRTVGGKGWSESTLPAFTGAQGHEVWIGRSIVSRHNTSAPDTTFGPFLAGAP